MTYPDITYRLRAEIDSQLRPLIDHNYAFLEVPYYDNPGDTLIWEGTRQFLSLFPHKCVRCTDAHGMHDSETIAPENMIILQGGGNWGDLWPISHDFRKKIIASHNQPILVMPQSVHYSDMANFASDKEFFAKKRNVTVCARDAVSANILEDLLPGKVLLVPDMAFFVDVKKFALRLKRKPTGKVLFAQRHDKEARRDMSEFDIPPHAEVSDWPQMNTSNSPFFKDYQRKLWWAYRLRQLTGIDRVTNFRDTFYQNYQRPTTLKWAVRWLDQFDSVWSTRLHISILAILLRKDLHVIDNSYCKTTNLINTWFK